jgi:squalene-hopene/tetraprenyl-beta-curcumene cyclase
MPQLAAVEIAVGLARFHNSPPRNPIMRLARRGAQASSLALLQEWQAADGSFLASPNWTAFVVMNLAGVGFQEHAIVQRGVEYLLSTVRADASWPLMADLSTRNTALAVKCLARGWADEPTDDESADVPAPIWTESLDWLLACQQTNEFRPMHIRAGGWAESDAPGAVPNVSDTSHALIALMQTPKQRFGSRPEQLAAAVARGLAWLLDRQHGDGGWSSCCGDPISRSTRADSADTTCDALCALAIALRNRQPEGDSPAFPRGPSPLADRVHAAAARGFGWLAARQSEDGSFAASAFGNEREPSGQNFVYGTARALDACAALGRLDSTTAQRAALWLARVQHASGGWGPPRMPLDYSGTFRVDALTRPSKEVLAKSCSVEETSWAVSALLPLAASNPVAAAAVANGLHWLATAVEQDLHRRPGVVGVWLAKLWYDERLYPLVFAADALTRAVREFAPRQPVETVTA